MQLSVLFIYLHLPKRAVDLTLFTIQDFYFLKGSCYVTVSEVYEQIMMAARIYRGNYYKYLRQN